MQLSTRLIRIASIYGFLLVTFGCSSEGKVEDFTPSEGNARKALEAALNHWQSGGQPGTVPNCSPVVEVTDGKWKSGQLLKSYEIHPEVKPAEPGPGPRFFKVRLTPPKGTVVETNYAVLGINPLLVYRDEDYQKMSGVGK
jgi:hypothetical protein